MQISDNQFIIKNILAGNQKLFSQVYQLHRREFIYWASKKFPNLHHETFVESYQEALISFYEQIMSGRLKELTCQLKSYIFLLGSRYIIKQYYKEKNTISIDQDEVLQEALITEPEYPWEDALQEQKDLMYRAMKMLQESCQKLLTARYFHCKKLEEIQLEFHYANNLTVRTSLSRCLKQVKDHIHDMSVKS